MKELTHFDEKGNAVMVDVTDKQTTLRSAVATGSIHVSEEIMQKVLAGGMDKGDVLGVARIAGIMGAKKTSELIPLCHMIMLTKCGIEFDTDTDKGVITATCTVKTKSETGVEMEALMGVQTALITIYDMCKAIDKRMTISDIHLVSKTGGKSGDFFY